MHLSVKSSRKNSENVESNDTKRDKNERRNELDRRCVSQEELSIFIMEIGYLRIIEI